jgi:ABC-type transport system involved in multi-copper enzyme maturation permease subunit
MFDLFRAEWTKIGGNRWVVSFLIWVFPLIAVLFTVVAALILALSSSARQGFAEDEAAIRWTEQAIGVWNLPNNPVGRLALLAFTAVVFAGEYQWGTWKNTIPRNRRLALILVKYVTLGVYVVVAFVLMSILWTLGMGLLAGIADTPYGPRISGSVLAEFGEDYLVQASVAFTSTIIAAGYAALAAMFTRSILGGVIAGFVMTLAEGGSILGLALVGYLLDIPRLVHVYRYLPFYNLINVSTWINENKPEPLEIDIGDTLIRHSDSLAFSLVVLAAWLVGLIGLTAYLFQRQDITS